MKTGTRGAAHRRTDNAVLRRSGDYKGCWGGWQHELGGGVTEARRAHAPGHARHDCGYSETRKKKADDEERDGRVAARDG
jgi:hypothetical protein